MTNFNGKKSDNHI